MSENMFLQHMLAKFFPSDAHKILTCVECAHPPSPQDIPSPPRSASPPIPPPHRPHGSVLVGRFGSSSGNLASSARKSRPRWNLGAPSAPGERRVFFHLGFSLEKTTTEQMHCFRHFGVVGKLPPNTKSWQKKCLLKKKDTDFA